MFTGLIEEIGHIETVPDNGQKSLRIECETVIREMRVGDSVSVDGVCLTVIAFGKNNFSVELSPETVDKTLLGQKKRGDAVNLERALLMGQRFGGHIVQGHIDGLVTVEDVLEQDRCREITFSCHKVSEPMLVEKGSVTVNGVSLTIARKTDLRFTVAIIPATLMNTTLSALKIKDVAHLETDILGRYVFSMSRSYVTS